MKNRHIWYAISFLVLNVLMYQGAEWLVWVFLTPLIMLSVQSSFRDALVSGSIVVVLAGYLWYWWLNFYSITTLISGFVIFYLFFMLFSLVIQFLLGTREVLFRNESEDDPAKGGKSSLLVVFIPPIVWFCFQKVLSYSAVGASWFDLAMFQPTMVPLIWFVGAKGITFMIVLFNSIIAACLLHRTRKIIMSGIGLLVLVVGCSVYSNSASPGGEPLKVALLQGNFNQSCEWRKKNAFKGIIDTYIDMTNDMKGENPDIIAWPEYAIPDALLGNRNLMERINEVVREVGGYLLLGTLSDLGGKVEQQDKIHNLAVLLSPASKEITLEKYISVRPMPFEKWVVPGTKLHTLSTEKAKLGVMLCFEELLPENASELSRQRAALFISLANNSRFQQTKGVYLASLQTRLRAAENAKYLARATNTGITQVINPCGKVIARTKPFSRETLTADVYLSDWVTPYARFGDKPMIIIIGVLCCFMAFNRFRGKGERRKEQGK